MAIIDLTKKKAKKEPAKGRCPKAAPTKPPAKKTGRSRGQEAAIAAYNKAMKGRY